MMAKISFPELDAYISRLSELYKDTEPIVKAAVYEGAGIVADEIKKGLESLPIQEQADGTAPYAKKGWPLYGVTRTQKEDLIDGFGLAPIKNENGEIQTKAGMDGYGRTKTPSYPKGVPNALLMRGIESGTSFRKKNPIFRKAANAAKKRAEEKMSESIDNSMKEIFGK